MMITLQIGDLQNSKTEGLQDLSEEIESDARGVLEG